MPPLSPKRARASIFSGYTPARGPAKCSCETRIRMSNVVRAPGARSCSAARTGVLPTRTGVAGSPSAAVAGALRVDSFSPRRSRTVSSCSDSEPRLTMKPRTWKKPSGSTGARGASFVTRICAGGSSVRVGLGAGLSSAYDGDMPAVGSNAAQSASAKAARRCRVRLVRAGVTAGRSGGLGEQVRDPLQQSSLVGVGQAGGELGQWHPGDLAHLDVRVGQLE